MSISAGINGFGRFSLHLVKYWLDRVDQAKFSIDYINDDFLSIDQALNIIREDPYVDYSTYDVQVRDGSLCFKVGGRELAIPYSHAPHGEIPWLGKPTIFLECSGKYTDADVARSVLQGDTKQLLISATSWNADRTLVFGFNHQDYDPAQHPVVSYGSCTVNGYVPLANYLHGRYGVVDSDVNVVHNIVRHRLAGHNTLQRKFCTLEKSAPLLLDFVDDTKNFVVTYSVVPWDGTSMIDYRFRLDNAPSTEALIEDLEQATAGGDLKGLYGLVDTDGGPQQHNCTPYSAVFVRDAIKVRNKSAYIPAYFDTENSVNRYFDLTDHVAGRLS